ncbi:HAD family hydrolase [Flavivirga eckloniae]|uniref:Cof-type HAD-IIB family hydrolase n=1 Tax=Flavivirga eckloniae TaxID=1803846 RepID=A0A2K9PLE8_9FLAO|nr:HAD family hydrolase [Flavivirga eckloniae]AUP77880.1 Cof-type HAD-IIB family hydrolase [Flavivirga eckloniae]
MNLSQVKLVVTDMDGTLLNSKHEVSTHFFDLFKKLKAHDIIFVAASGRQYCSMIDKLDTIKDDIIIVSENGGLAVKNDTTLLSTPISPDNLPEIVSLISTLDNTHPVFCTQYKAYAMSTSKPLVDLLSEYYTNYSIIDHVDAIEEDIFKIALYHEVSSEKHVYPHVKHLESKYKVKVSANHWVDISEDLANKGHAISLIQKAYDITEEETMVFGDYNNDLEMLKLGYFSYAMQNAHPNVKETARFETKNNDNAGVEYILEQLVNAKDALKAQ